MAISRVELLRLRVGGASAKAIKVPYILGSHVTLKYLPLLPELNAYERQPEGPGHWQLHADTRKSSRSSFLAALMSDFSA
jgi:hypothetical protein